jgi:phage terminase large subunit-like protein
MEFGLRLGDNPQVVATTTPRPIKLIRTLIADPQTVVTAGHTDENRANLSERFVQRVIRKYEGTRMGRQELAGEILDDNPDALWQRQTIETNRVTKAPERFRKIIIGVDPQAKDAKAGGDETAAETGIVVVGLGFDNHAYVLYDASTYGTPNEWGNAAVSAYRDWKANTIVAEVNNGGAMVEYVIATVARSLGVVVAYEAVHASRGKEVRAEPVAALYEQGRAHHVGAFPSLEDQMCQWMPGEKSPDRMDALVWAITQLMPDLHKSEVRTAINPADYFDLRK